MKKQNVLLIIYFLAIAFAFSACQKSTAENNQASPQSLPTVSPTSSLSSILSPNSDSPIRKVDFKNFAFPETKDYPEFRLKDGEKPYEHMREDGIDLFKIEYSDLTNDGKEEAILMMSIQTGGSAIPNLIYIYTLKNGKPKLLWEFMTGDRADGGLKKIYTENGELIVELFGDSKIVDDKWSFHIPEEKYLGDGRPSIYTKNRFKWDGKKFTVEGKPELFDYDWKKRNEENQ